MFKKLRDKIHEEVQQSSLKLPASVQQYTQQLSSTTTDASNGGVPPFPQDDLLVDISGIKPAGDNKDLFSIDEESPGATPEHTGLQGLQLVDLHDGPQFPPSQARARRDSLDSSCSSVYAPAGAGYQAPMSDLESCSEWEDSAWGGDKVPKEVLYQAYVKTRQRYQKYKGRYTDAVAAYREKEREADKLRTLLSNTQDKAMRRQSELREQCSLETQAKAHLESELRSDLEERDLLVAALQTKVRLLQEGYNSSSHHLTAKSNASLDSGVVDSTSLHHTTLSTTHSTTSSSDTVSLLNLTPDLETKHVENKVDTDALMIESATYGKETVIDTSKANSSTLDSSLSTSGTSGNVSLASEGTDVSTEIIERLKVALEQDTSSTDLAGDLAQHKQLLSRCMDNIRANKDRMGQLQGQVGRYEGQVSSLKGQVAGLQDKLAHFEKDSFDLTVKLQETQLTLETSSLTMAETKQRLFEELQTKEAEVEELQVEVQRLRNTSALEQTTEGEAAGLEKEAIRLAAELGNQKNKTLTGKTSSARGKQSTRGPEVEKGALESASKEESETCVLEAKIKDLKEKNNQSEDLVCQLTNDCAEMESKLASFEKKNEKSKAELNNLNCMYNELQRLVQSHVSDKNTLEFKVKEERKAKDVLTSKMAEATGEVDMLKKNLKKVELRLAECTKEKLEVEAKVICEAGEKEALVKKTADLHERNLALQDQYVLIVTEKQKLDERLTKLMAELEVKLNDLVQEREKLNVAYVEKELLQQQLKMCNTVIEDNQGYISRLTTENDDNKKRVAELGTQVTEVNESSNKSDESYEKILVEHKAFGFGLDNLLEEESKLTECDQSVEGKFKLVRSIIQNLRLNSSAAESKVDEWLELLGWSTVENDKDSHVTSEFISTGIQELKNRTKNLNDNNSKLRDNLVHQKAEKDRINSQFLDKQKECEELVSKISESESDLQNSKEVNLLVKENYTRFLSSVKDTLLDDCGNEVIEVSISGTVTKTSPETDASSLVDILRNVSAHVKNIGEVNVQLKNNLKKVKLNNNIKSQIDKRTQESSELIILLDKNIVSFQDNVKQCDFELHDLQAEKQIIMSEINQKFLRIDELEQEVTSKDEIITKLDESIFQKEVSTAEEIQELKDEADVTRSEVVVCGNDKLVLEEQTRRLDLELESVTKDLAEVEEKLAARETEIKTLKDQLTENITEIENLRINLAEIQQYQVEIEKLEGNLSEINAGKDSLGNRFEDICAEKASLVKKLEEAGIELEKLKQELKDNVVNRADLVKLDKKLADHYLQQETLKAELEESKGKSAELENLQTQFADTKTEKKNLEREMSENNDKLHNLKDQLTESSCQNLQLEKQLKEHSATNNLEHECLKKNLEEKDVQLGRVKEELSENNVEIENLRTKLTENERNEKAKTQLMDETRKDLLANKKELDIVRAELELQVQHVSDAQNDLNILSVRLEEATADLDANRKDLAQKDQKLVEIQSELSSCRKDLAKKLEDVSCREAQYLDLSNELENTKLELISSAEELSNKTSEITLNQKLLDNHANEIQKIQNSLDKCSSELDERTKELSVKELKMTEVVEELQVVKENVCNFLNGLRKNVGKDICGNDQLCEVGKEFEANRLSLDECRKNIEVKANQSILLEYEIAELKKEVSDASMEIKTLRQQLDNKIHEAKMKEDELGDTKLSSTESVKELNSVKLDLSMAQTEVKELSVTLEKSLDDSKELKTTHQVCLAELEKTKKDILESRKKLEMVLKECSVMEEQLQEAGLTLARCKDEFDEKSKEMKLENENLKKESNAYTVKIDDLNTANECSSKKLFEKTNLITSMEAKLSSESDRVLQLQTEVNLIQKQLETAKQEKLDSEITFGNQLTLLEEKRLKEASTAKQQICSLNEAIEKKQNELSEQFSNVGSLESQNNKYETELAESRVQLQSSKQDIEKLLEVSKNLETAKREIYQLKRYKTELDDSRQLIKDCLESFQEAEKSVKDDSETDNLRKNRDEFNKESLNQEEEDCFNGWEDAIDDEESLGIVTAVSRNNNTGAEQQTSSDRNHVATDLDTQSTHKLVASLRFTVQHHVAKVANMELTTSLLRERIAVLEQDLEQKDKSDVEQNLRLQLSQLEKRLLQEKRDLQTRMEKQQRQYEKQTLEKFDSMTVTHSTDVCTLEKRVEEMKNVEKNHLKSVEELEQKSSSLELELVGVKEERDGVISQVEISTADLQRLTKERDSLLQRVTDLEEQVKSIQASKSSLEESISSQNNKNFDLNSKYSKTCLELDDLKSQLRVSLNNNSSLTNSNEKLTQSLSLEVKKNECQEEHLGKVKNKCVSLDKEILELKQKTEVKCKKEKNEKARTEESLKTRISQLEEQALVLKSEEEQKRAQVEETHRVKVEEREEGWKRQMEEVTQQCENERKELERLSSMAAEAFRSGSTSVDALRATVAQQSDEIRGLRNGAEVRELRALLAMRRPSEARGGVEGRGVAVGGALEDAAEYEYLRNVLYEYLRGKQTHTLAKVLCAVVKFDEQQQQEILQHHSAQEVSEEQSSEVPVCEETNRTTDNL